MGNLNITKPNSDDVFEAWVDLGRAEGLARALNTLAEALRDGKPITEAAMDLNTMSRDLTDMVAPVKGLLRDHLGSVGM